MRLIQIFAKIIKLVFLKADLCSAGIITWFKFIINGVDFKRNFVAKGVPVVNVNLKGKLSIGESFVLHSGNYNMIGRQQPCYFIVGPGASLTIGNNVGISCTAIICQNCITIGNDVKIGGNVVIYDTDFHSLIAAHRNATPENKSTLKTKPVVIQDGAFIGAHSTILKGVNIGKNAIVGAGAVVSKDIPDNEIWAGNPARFVKKIESSFNY